MENSYVYSHRYSHTHTKIEKIFISSIDCFLSGADWTLSPLSSLLLLLLCWINILFMQAVDQQHSCTVQSLIYSAIALQTQQQTARPPMVSASLNRHHFITKTLKLMYNWISFEWFIFSLSITLDNEFFNLKLSAFLF